MHAPECFWEFSAMKNKKHEHGVFSRTSKKNCGPAKQLLIAAMVSFGLMTSIAAEAQKSKGHAKGPVKQCLSASLTHFDGTIVDAALATPSLSTLADAVVAAGLADALSGEGRLTVFAPTNDAFAAIPPAILDSIVSDTAILTEVLTYHVLPRAIDARRAIGRHYALKTLQGQKVFVRNSRRHGPTVNQSGFNCNGVLTSNGVVWIIDSVLLPQFKQAQ